MISRAAYPEALLKVIHKCTLRRRLWGKWRFWHRRRQRRRRIGASDLSLSDVYGLELAAGFSLKRK